MDNIYHYFIVWDLFIYLRSINHINIFLFLILLVNPLLYLFFFCFFFFFSLSSPLPFLIQKLRFCYRLHRLGKCSGVNPYRLFMTEFRLMAMRSMSMLTSSALRCAVALNLLARRLTHKASHIRPDLHRRSSRASQPGSHMSGRTTTICYHIALDIHHNNVLCIHQV